ncbi:hypothetical protein AUC43_07665 [Hymenobacter sedentarius]|uniref:STAS/SEC14 domain-containing protein n=1 Tax=Hymenobacter sedentarius TaxID=1411621 RepID=A0A0U3SWS4_9BACT|nr:hypothetical protein [Hymenobacter sedentarius]ALW84979.1 hypothetical protein AUC43_07665 [Hymenobacter sedentarius]
MTTATPRLYFKNALGCLYGHPDGYALIRFNAGTPKPAELQALFTQVRRLLELNRWHRFLTDQRLLAPCTPAEVAWIVTHWRDTAAEHPDGLYGAVVMSHNVFTRLVMGQIVQEANVGSMHFRRFETEAEATAWIEHVG